MKKVYALLSLVVAILIIVNIFFYLHIYRQQITYQKETLIRQTQTCGWEVEKNINDLQNELQKLLFTRNLNVFFTNPQERQYISFRIESMISKYSSLINSIQIFDTETNYFIMQRDRSNNLISDRYLSRNQKPLVERELAEVRNGEIHYSIPVYSPDNNLNINILVTLNLHFYMLSNFDNYHVGDSQWQLLLDSDGMISLHNHTGENVSMTKQHEILQDILEGIEGTLTQTVTLGEKEHHFITAHYPINLLGKDYGIVFLLKSEKILSSVLFNIIFLAAATFIILIVIIVIFIYFFRRKQLEEKKLKDSEGSLKKILESLPIGIFFTGPDSIIRSVNFAALEILRIRDEKMLIGKDSSAFFLQFKDTPLAMRDLAEGSRLYVYYDEHDNEILIYKKEIPLELQEEKILLEAFVDFTPFENSRKAEAASNTSKSEFITKISQDIRTPLNGILSMTESLKQSKSTPAREQEKIEIIRKSSELLVSVVNDLIDFSKTETGKIVVEESPFVLNSEVSIVVDSFKTFSEKEKIDISVHYGEDIPEEVIGDPFLVRQILTNLISNALKYSGAKKININTRLVFRKEESLLIRISVEDNGKGISSNIVETVFSETYSSYVDKLHSCEGLMKSKKLAELMGGEFVLQSPAPSMGKGSNQGTLASFTIQVFSNKGTEKKLNLTRFKNYSDIRTLIFSDPGKKELSLIKLLKDFEIQSEITPFNEMTIPVLKIRVQNDQNNTPLLIIPDTIHQNGFAIAREIFINDLSNHFLILMISSNNKPGNLIKSKRMGVDYYLLYPYEASEIFDFIQNHFTGIAIPKSKPLYLKKIRKDISILLVEDNDINQKAAQIIFKNLGFEIDVAANGLEAVNMVKERKPDIVFMDIRMPIKSGFDATYEIRNLGFTNPIVALTANATDMDKSKAVEVGMNDFLVKPVRVETIKNVLIKWFSEPV